jgi:predicted site-specific integrase-resolvase
MTDNGRLLNLVDVATQLRLSPHTIRKFVKDGKLQPVRICRRLLFDPLDIEKFLGSGRWQDDK